MELLKTTKNVRVPPGTQRGILCKSTIYDGFLFLIRQSCRHIVGTLPNHFHLPFILAECLFMILQVKCIPGCQVFTLTS